MHDRAPQDRTGLGGGGGVVHVRQENHVQSGVSTSAAFMMMMMAGYGKTHIQRAANTPDMLRFPSEVVMLFVLRV